MMIDRTPDGPIPIFLSPELIYLFQQTPAPV
jgi:hypothetical protein